MDDVRAVLDAAGSSSAVLHGSHDGCSMAALFAPTYPERARALALFHPVAHARKAEFGDSEAGSPGFARAGGTQEWTDEMLGWKSPSLLESRG